MPRRAPTYPLVAQADRAKAVMALSRISVSSSGDWLHSSNVYYSDAQQKIRADRSSIPNGQVPDFSEYLSAGAFVHCGDAWGYLGRALDALLRGDVHTAVHLVYYAELRGALSLLSTEGVYVGDFFSCALNSTGTVTWISEESTHQSIWKVLDEWNKSPRSADLIGVLLRPGGVELSSWAATIPNGATAPIISDLLDRMKFDLQSFAGDRQRRNQASYNPTRLTVNDILPESAASIVSNVWRALEPDARGSFPVLDRSLMGDILATSYGSVHKVIDEDGEPTEETDWSHWEAWLEGLIPTRLSSTALHDELLSVPYARATSIVSAAFSAQTSSSIPSTYIEGMLIRATILLRLATGACIHLLKDSGLSEHDIEPWVTSLSLSRGLWPVNDPPEDYLDLWADTQIALETLQEEHDSDLYDFLHRITPYLATFGQAERVVAWSFS